MSISGDARAAVRNQLLSRLPLEEYQRLLPYLETIYLSLRQTIYNVDEPIEYVYFPQTAMISLLILMADGTAVEIATVGKEGMVGVPLLLGYGRFPGQAIAQVPGIAFRMKADVFLCEIAVNNSMYHLLQCYTQTLFNQVAQTAACNRLHSIEERFCRWLLTIHDQVGADEFLLTQESLAQMLGVRRAGVSEVARTFQQNGAIQYSRGKMMILNRTGLDTSVCECYGKIQQEFERLSNPPQNSE
ncbi:MAG: Crp/Fnr family transcriptional regulator [Nostoc sp. C3-bin3]|nr:Crp/Fnr family transcriptional regulator [Nostoc sp. C3-bin3]